MGGLGFVIAMTVALLLCAGLCLLLALVIPLLGLINAAVFIGLIALIWWLYIRYGG